MIYDPSYDLLMIVLLLLSNTRDGTIWLSMTFLLLSVKLNLSLEAGAQVSQLLLL
jgi:hypothetical protein